MTNPLPVVRALGKESNPAGARWCQVHARLECTRMRRGGKLECHSPAIRGLSACRTHCGMTGAKAKAKGEQVITAWNANGRMDQSIQAAEAVVRMLHMSWMRATMYGELLRQQVATSPSSAGGTDEDAPTASGLIGYRYGMGGREGVTYVQSEEVRALVDLESAERDRVMRYAKMAHDMGISERMTSLAERLADEMSTRLGRILDGLGLTPAQQDLVPILVQSHFSTLDADLDMEV